MMSESNLKLRIGATSMVMASLFAAGCASSAPEPTHRWVSLDNASGAEYRVENGRCAIESAGDSKQRAFNPDMPEYEKYVACMKAQGYSLVAQDTETAR